ncbi:glycerate kinase [Psychroflexus sp. MES1-P1E]|uniref:glycerate kinase n=1 Tax=Psychroflexus sp. MES1-P1E TaxID=2058320 RepID=UPI000C7C5B2A|nr:glycerate kinase [Psychroflexus sp. MES1-P1E]PKG41686.1 glycerate kinase [Psychroflexus sp. MES1-P1E]
MKIVIAPDKFKGSLSSLEFCSAVEDAIHRISTEVDILKLPLADGGDGTIDIANYYLGGSLIEVEVKNPLFQLITASYLYAETSQTAYIEMAEASGLWLLKEEEQDCKNTTTFGTGEMILHAIEKGAKKIILGIGGSATNDCGIGMATALGYKFIDRNNKEVKPIGASLSQICSIDDANVSSKLKQVEFQVACDVNNPLYGKNGAAHVYAKQKGASKEDIEMLDHGLTCFSKVLTAQFNVQPQAIKGAGAAGGTGIATIVFLKAKLESGIQVMKELANFDHQIADADWIITGEGKLDVQTLSGKTIDGVLKSAKIYSIPVAVFCGQIELDKEALTNFGITYAQDILSRSINLDDALNNSYKHLFEIAETFAKKAVSNEI